MKKAIVVLLAAMMVCGVMTATAPTARATNIAGFKAEALRLINEERAQASVPALKCYEPLNRLAQEVTVEYSKYPEPNRTDDRLFLITILAEYGIDWSRASASYSVASSCAVGIFPGDYPYSSSLLDPEFTHIGIGIVAEGANGNPYMVLVFISNSAYGDDGITDDDGPPTTTTTTTKPATTTTKPTTTTTKPITTAPPTTTTTTKPATTTTTTKPATTTTKPATTATKPVTTTTKPATTTTATKPSPKTIGKTSYISNFWNWFMYIFFFGFLWMK